MKSKKNKEPEHATYDQVLEVGITILQQLFDIVQMTPIDDLILSITLFEYNTEAV